MHQKMNGDGALLFLLLPLLLVATSSLVRNLEEEDCGSVGCPSFLCQSKKLQEDICSRVKCKGIEPSDCPPGSQFELGLTMCGCCAGCSIYLKEGEECFLNGREEELDPTCTSNDTYCPVLKNECRVGLYCDPFGSELPTCVNPGFDQENAIQQSCLFKRGLYQNGELHWEPVCEEDGSYAPKQCKGSKEDGVCFCVDSDGKRLYGREWWEDADNQTCACSILANKLRKEGKIASFHCSLDGNFEKLQCDSDSGLCYCVQETTGNLMGAVVPEYMWRTLPCFSVNMTSNSVNGTVKYLKLCDSEWVASEQARRDADQHGTEATYGNIINCDFDGSYGPVQKEQENSVNYCSYKDGFRMKYRRESFIHMDCNCARDFELYREIGRPFRRSCDRFTGNYAPSSEYDFDNVICVDQDGFYFREPVPKEYQCCLDCTDAGNCCQGEPEEIRNMCYNPLAGDNTGKIRPCNFWPT